MRCRSSGIQSDQRAFAHVSATSWKTEPRISEKYPNNLHINEQLNNVQEFFFGKMEYSLGAVFTNFDTQSDYWETTTNTTRKLSQWTTIIVARKFKRMARNAVTTLNISELRKQHDYIVEKIEVATLGELEQSIIKEGTQQTRLTYALQQTY